MPRRLLVLVRSPADRQPLQPPAQLPDLCLWVASQLAPLGGDQRIEAACYLVWAEELAFKENGVFGPIICLTWEEAGFYVVLEHDYAIEPFETTREHIADLSVTLGFNGIHIRRVHEGQTYRRPKPFK